MIQEYYVYELYRIVDDDTEQVDETSEKAFVVQGKKSALGSAGIRETKDTL